MCRGFCLGGGSNAEEIFKYFQNHPDVKVCLLLSNNPQATFSNVQKSLISYEGI
jgi:tryptophan synthase beta subunit